jgi:hypothetical protein
VRLERDSDDLGAGDFQGIEGGDERRVRRAVAVENFDRVIEGGEEGVVVGFVHVVIKPDRARVVDGVRCYLFASEDLRTED